MSTGYLRWGGWAAVSTSPTEPAVTSAQQGSTPVVAAATAGVMSGQMQCGGDSPEASRQAGTQQQRGTPAPRSEQAG